MNKLSNSFFRPLLSSPIVASTIGGVSVALLLLALKLIVEKIAVLLRSNVVIDGKTISLNAAERELLSSVIRPADLHSTFADVGGLEETKKMLYQHIIWPFKNLSQISRRSVRAPPKGILLYGPPGTGKTLLARALAKELNSSFINVKLDSLFSKWHGETEKNVAAIFSLARSLAPTIIFVDEIDSILSMRKDADSNAAGNAKAMFMTEWDGLENHNQSIIVVGATNRRSSIDSAILRRLPLQIKVDYPDSISRAKILRVLLSNDIESSEKMDSLVSFVVANTHNYSGGDLEELCKAAALLSLQDQRSELKEHDTLPEITVEHFVLALQRVKGNRNVSGNSLLFSDALD